MASKRPTLGRNVDIKPPSIPSNIETIYFTTDKDAVFNTRGYYADLDNKIDEQKVTAFPTSLSNNIKDILSEIAVKCLSKIKNKTIDDLETDTFFK